MIIENGDQENRGEQLPETGAAKVPRGRLARRLLLPVPALLLLLAGLAGGWAIGMAGAPPLEDQGGGLPDWVYSSSLSLKGYQAAVEIGKSLQYFPCYCDCGEASRHTSLEDCFFQEDGSFDDHASACDVCGNEVLDVRTWGGEGLGVRQIRDRIDEKYREYGTPTETPYPPAAARLTAR